MRRRCSAICMNQTAKQSQVSFSPTGLVGTAVPPCSSSYRQRWPNSAGLCSAAICRSGKRENSGRHLRRKRRPTGTDCKPPFEKCVESYRAGVPGRALVWRPAGKHSRRRTRKRDRWSASAFLPVTSTGKAATTANRTFQRHALTLPVCARHVGSICLTRGNCERDRAHPGENATNAAGRFRSRSGRRKGRGRVAHH
jgi:hypothetical protein